MRRIRQTDVCRSLRILTRERESGAVGCHPRLFAVAAFAAGDSVGNLIALDSYALVAEIMKLRGGRTR